MAHNFTEKRKQVNLLSDLNQETRETEKSNYLFKMVSLTFENECIIDELMIDVFRK